MIDIWNWWNSVDGHVCWNSKRRLLLIVCRPRRINFRFPFSVYICIYVYVCIYIHVYICIYCIWCRLKRKIEAQAILLNLFTVRSSCERKSFRLFTKKQTEVIRLQTDLTDLPICGGQWALSLSLFLCHFVEAIPRHFAIPSGNSSGNYSRLLWAGEMPDLNLGLLDHSLERQQWDATSIDNEYWYTHELFYIGWVDNLNGPTGMLAGASKGVLRTLHCRYDHHPS